MEIEVSITLTWLFQQVPLIHSYSFMGVQETNIQTHWFLEKHRLILQDVWFRNYITLSKINQIFIIMKVII